MRRRILDTDWENLDPLIKKALEINDRFLLILNTCTHPIAPLELHTTETVTHWSKRNYIKSKICQERATAIFQEWIKQGIVVPAEPNGKACFSMLTVPKKDDFGIQTDIRLCIDMGPGNKYIIVDQYPLPLTTEVLKVPTKHRGKNAFRSKIDLTGAFNRVPLVFQCS
jgi:hypothetical protein